MEIVPCWNLFIVGISPYYLVYLNAPIYLVKGGRLILLPSVLFHSCRPSFRHIGVMFPDFAFLTRLGYNGNPLTVRLEYNSSSNAQPWFYHLPPSLFFPWVSGAQGSSLFNPPRASAPLSVGPPCQPPVATRGNSGLAYRKFGQSECALRTRYVQLLSGFVGTFGWCCWICFNLSKLSSRTRIPSMIGMSREKVYPSLTVRACHGLSWDSPAGIELSKAVPAVMGRWEFVNVRL